ncbi:MAG: hypothetical protein K2X27_05110 [Candidatus Obscuribacterales bacterium]|nr:hypothetical protein [Candidatus Obscuribacterales bacterium]
MSKSLKDIVEDGFAKLSALSEKRNELLQTSRLFLETDSQQQAEQGAEKLKATEALYGDEITKSLERSNDILQQSMSQIVEDNERFLSSLKENLQLKIAKVFKDLSYTREWLLVGASERFDSSVRPLEREMAAGATGVQFEAAKLLGELEAACKRNECALHEAQAEIAGNLAKSEHELTGSLGNGFGNLVQESEKRRSKVNELLEGLYSEQNSQMSSMTSELEKKIALLVKNKMDALNALGKATQESVDGVKEDATKAASTELVSLSQEAFTELEASYEFSNNEIQEKLLELRTQTEQLLTELRQSLLEGEEAARLGLESVFEETKSKAIEDNQLEKPKSSPVDDALVRLGREMENSTAEFKRQLSELLKIQSERLGNLAATAESSISASATALNTELKQLVRLHEQAWSEKEQELLLRLRKLEKEAQDTYNQVSEAGLLSDGSV